MTMTGPILGAFLMSITTLQYVMLIVVVGATLAVFTLSFVRIPKYTTTRTHAPKITEDIRQGIGVIRANSLLLRMFIPVFITSIIFCRSVRSYH